MTVSTGRIWVLSICRTRGGKIDTGITNFFRRAARVQVLQTRLDGMLALSAARALVYAGGGATGMLVKDYGKNAEQEIWKFDASLVAQICDVLKQAAIEEGQWTEKRPLSSEVGISEITRRLNAGRQRVSDAKAAMSRAPT